MPEYVAFDTFAVVVITEFCIMAAVLVVVIGRSFDRAFRHLEVVTELREQIDALKLAPGTVLATGEGQKEEG